MPWKIVKRDGQHCVHKLRADGTVGESVTCHKTRQQAVDHLRALYANVKEFRGHFHDVMVVQEFKGLYPDVPVAQDINLQELTAGDDDPMFITIPIGKAGATSGNGRYYDDAFVQELERQVLANKPIGLMGHLAEQDRATAFPPEAVHWLGVQRIGELLWGKGYVPPGEARERIRRYKAQGKKIATSIAAYAEGKYDAAVGALRMIAETLRLDQIDIAPADRAGIPDLAAVPLLTREMVEEIEAELEAANEEDESMERLDVINSLTAEEARLLPDAVRNAVLAAAPEVQVVQEMRRVLGLSAEANIVQTVQEMRQTEETRRTQEVRSRITELAKPEAEKGIKLDGVRELVVEMVTLRNPQTVADADRIYGEVLEMDSVKKALQAQVINEMGPNQTTPIQGQSQPDENAYFILPKLDEAK